MSIEEQVEIVESNIAEYGVCDITIEEYRYLKQKIREEVIDNVLKIKTYRFGIIENREFIFVEDILKLKEKEQNK